MKNKKPKSGSNPTMEEAMAAGMKIKAPVSLSNDERIKEELRILNLEVIQDHRRMN